MDNDKRILPKWKAFSYDNLYEKVETMKHRQLPDGSLEISIQGYAAPVPMNSVNIWDAFYRFRLNYVYVIHTNGAIDFEMQGDYEATRKRNEPPYLPKIGVEFRMPREYAQVEWYGLGPGEAYIDTYEAQKVGLFRKDVRGLATDYLRPQENGNRHQTHWVDIHNRRGQGLRITGLELFDFSARHYSNQALTEANHPWELKEEDEITVNLDCGQSGSGSGACGPMPWEKHRLMPGHHCLKLRIEPHR